MALIVQKYGGSSVADANSIKRVANRVVSACDGGKNKVVVVVSAMGDTTDDLIDLAGKVTSSPSGRELDMLLTAGERISMALLAMAIKDLGVAARSFTGSQAGMITDATHGNARIVDITPKRIYQALEQDPVAIVAGFQGFSRESGDITTLGRGGSDTNAVALAAGLKAEVCEIFTDVSGVFTADPRVIPKATKLSQATFGEMLELSASGAKVLYSRAVELGRRHSVPIHVRSSFTLEEGTLVLARRDVAVEEPIVSGVAVDKSEAKVTVVGVPDRPGKAAEIFSVVAETEVNIDMIVQNVSNATTGLTDISFTLPESYVEKVQDALNAKQSDIGFLELLCDKKIGKLSVVGDGMRGNSGVSATFFKALADSKINVEMISTSEIRISVITRIDSIDAAAQAVHTAFGLDSDTEAVVYAGTGR